MIFQEMHENNQNVGNAMTFYLNVRAMQSITSCSRLLLRGDEAYPSPKGKNTGWEGLKTHDSRKVDKDLHNLHPSPNIILVIKSWWFLATRMGEARTAHRTVFGTNEDKRSPGITSRSRADDTKTNAVWYLPAICMCDDLISFYAESMTTAGRWGIKMYIPSLYFPVSQSTL
jgi:hypothetical protein